MKAFDLYLDESGTFTEGQSGQSAPTFPSQLAGVLAPADTFGQKEAASVLVEAYAAIDTPLPDLVHAKDIRRGERFDGFVTGLCHAFERRATLQAVRLENRESVGFGTIEATYTRMIAELCVRVLERLAQEHEGEIRLNLTGALYMVKGEVQLSVDAYRKRLVEHIAYTTVRRGLPRESARSKLGMVRTGSGRKRRELQCCDVLSNASHANYKKLGPGAKDALKATFGAFDWTLTIRDLDRRVDEHLDQGSVGLALRDLTEELVGGEPSRAARLAAEKRLPDVLDVLANASAPSRSSQLAVLFSWLEQLSEHRRDPETAHAAARWLLKRIDAPLRARLGDRATSLDPFAMQLWRHALTAANHRGALLDAREASGKFDELLPSLAGRWEFGELITEGMTAQAVHLTDCFEYEDAARRAGSVAAYYGELSSLLCVALPEVFPEVVRSEQRGKALGTQLQAEMYAGLRDPERFEVARGLNDRAIAEFATEADRARQHQYRAQLETFAGEFDLARDYLARSLDADASHEAIGDAIAGLPHFPQGFALLHWLRLGAALLNDGSPQQRDAFLAAWLASPLSTGPWSRDEGQPYPGHGIRRYQAVIAARRGEGKLALSMLGRLRSLDSGPSSHPLMALIVSAAHMEVAALIWSTDKLAASRLLAHKDSARPGAKQRLAFVRPRLDGLPRLLDWVDEGTALIGRVLGGDAKAYEVEEGLLKLARRVGY